MEDWTTHSTTEPAQTQATSGAPSERRRRTLGDELRFVIYLVSGATLLMAGVVYVVYQAFALYSQAVVELEHSGEMVSAELTAAFADNDVDTAGSILGGLVAAANGRVATVYRADGSVFGSTAPAQPVPALRAAHDARFGTQLKGTELVHMRPVVVDNELVGALRLRASLSHYFRALYRNIIVGAIVIALAFALAFVASLRLQRRITRPITAMLSNARNSGNAPHLLAALEGDITELAELNDVYRALLGRIEDQAAALDENTGYFLSIINNAVDIIAILNPDGRIRFVNRAAKRLLGYDSEELVDRYPTELAEPGDCSPLTDVVAGKRELAQGEHLVLEVRVRHRDGTLRPFEVTVTNITEDPRVAGYVLNARDVALHKQVVEQHREMRELLDAVFENIPHMVFVKDAKELRFVRLNKAAEAILGYPRASFLGKNDYDFFPADEAQFFTDTDRQVLAGREVVDIPEEPVTSGDGSTRILHTKKIPIALGGAQPAYLLGISEDITQRKEAEQRYRNVVEHAADAFFLHDMQGRFIDVNRAACRSLGYTREELLTMSVPDIEMNFVAENVKGHWSDLEKGVPQTVSGVHRRKDGSTFPVEVRLRLIWVGDQQQIIATARDISGFLAVQSELREAKEAAEAASRVKTEFLANMSHEIRTPINAVVGMTDLLLRTPLGPKQQDYVRAVRNSADLLTNVIDDILDISLLETGQLVLQTDAFAIEALLEPVLDMLGHRAYSKGIELACRYQVGQLPTLSGDCSRIRQVLVNLVGNAVKFTDQGWVIIDVAVESETEADVTLKFTVEDTGMGIEAGQKARLFAPFTQLDPSIHRHYGGVGLGLSISKRLVNLMGGQIGVDDAESGGAAFWFTLPFGKSARHAPEHEALADDALRVLLIDDQPAVAEATRACLTPVGVRIDVVTSAQAALDCLQAAADQAPYTAVVIDVEMPDIDGVSLARRIRATPSLAAVDIILVPSIAEPLPPGVVSELDARCVNKPVVPRILLATLTNSDPAPAIQQSEATDQATAARETAPPRVLVAEDNPVSQAVLRDMLEVLGCPVTGVADGAAALKAMQTADYDVVLLDCQMPGMDGFEAAAEIRRRTGDPLKPAIIAVTAYAFDSDTRRCLAAGMNDVIHKPVRLAALKRALQQWWDAPAEGEPASDAMHLDNEFWLDLRRRSGSDSTFIATLIELFRQDAEQRLGDLADQVAAGRHSEAARTAHALRAGCLQVGAQRMAELSAALEASAGHSDAERAATLLTRLQQEFSQVSELLVREMGTP